ncbi:oligosaccharide flippase family protein [Vibrio breoganii]
MSNNFRNILSNWLSLTILQGGNYIVPLVLTPYLIITLGIEAFGILSFAMALNVFFITLVSYGFDLTGTKMIAEVSNDKSKVSVIFQDIFYSKLLIALFSFVILLGLISVVSQFNEQKYLILAYFSLVVADVFFPVWLYQGMQRMKAITFLKLSGRFVYVALTIYLVKSSEDLLYLPLIEGGVAIFVALVAFIWGIKGFSLQLKLSTFKRIICILKNSWHVFISNVAVLFYTRFNIILLGLITSPTSVGHYAVAEKIYMAVRSMFNPIIQAIFPYLSKIKQKDKNKYDDIVKVSFVFVLTVLSILSILLYSFGDYILYFLLKSNDQYVQSVLSVFSVCLVFAVGGFLSTILIIEDKGKVLSKITFCTVMVNLIIVYPLVVNYQALGLAICFLIVQASHFIMQLIANRGIFQK